MNGNAVSKNLSRPPIALLVVLLFSTLSPNVDLFPARTWHDGQRSLQCAALIGLLLLGLFRPAGTSKTVGWSRGAVIGCGLFFLIGAISGAFSAYPQWALLEAAWFLALVLLGWRIVCELRELPSVTASRWIVAACALASMAFLAKAGVIYFGMMTTGRDLSQPFDLLHLFAGFSNPRFFGQWATLLLPVLLLLGNFPNRSRYWRIAAFLLPSLMWALVFASYTRGSWAGLAFGFLAVALLGGQQAKRVLRLAGATALAGGIIYVLLFMVLPLVVTGGVWVKQRHDVMTLAGRDIHWTLAIDMITQYPWLGIGPMHFAIAQNHGEYLRYIGATHPHNAVLQIAAEWGIPATLIALLLVLRFIRMWCAGFRAASSAHPMSTQVDTYLALTAALAGAAAQSMVDGVLVMPVSQMTVVLFVAWAMAINWQSRGGGITLHAPLLRWALRGIHALVLIAVIHGVVPDIFSPDGRIERYQLAHPDIYLWPRFWAQGWIDQ